LRGSLLPVPAKKFQTILLVGAALALAWALIFNHHQVNALTLNSARDCDDNAVIRCGAASPAELNDRFGQDGAAEVFRCFGISSTDVSNIDNTAVAGRVTKDGQVFINSRTSPVATGAITAGRQNISGSTTIHCGGKTFYERPPSVSFVSNSLAAFVVMSNGRFDYAILASCGNPVKATPLTPVVKPTPPPPAATPAPAPPPVAPPPPAPQVQSQTITVTPPAPAPTPAPVAQKTLPSTGPGDVLAVGAVATFVGTASHYLYLRRRLSP
jgi:cell division septation protein DedD